MILTTVILLAAYICDHQWLPATCETPETCEKCGATQGLPLDHTWLAATCDQAESCQNCGETQGDPLGHSWLAATCTEAERCTVCGQTRAAALGHQWLEATCHDPKTCAVCGETEGVNLEHTFIKATCTTPKTCSLCGDTQGEPMPHAWAPATCDTPETCVICGATQGDPAEHIWTPATCTSPKTCAVCGLTEGDVLDHTWKDATCSSPKTCTVCEKTEGAALAHTWADATCTSAKTCTVCGATSGRALGHKFEDNAEGTDKLCTVCGRSITTKYVALTFDDGPSGSLSLKLLEELEARGAKATFFVCGYRVKLYPDVPQTVLNYGHELALHTSTHANLTTLTADQIRKELQDTLDLLPEDSDIRLMRPPGGNYNSTVKSVCSEMGLAVMLWSLDTRDWATKDADTVVDKIVNNVNDGDVILMHELKNHSIEAALKAIDILQGQGYEFVTVSQLAEIQNKTIAAGGVYTSIR